MTSSERDSEPNVRVKRMAERGMYDRATIDAILEETYVGHVAFVDAGLPVVIPVVVWRYGEHVHFHAANKGRLASVCANNPVCIAVTHLDGLVLARSAYNHSMNYRSLVIHGRAEVIDDTTERLQALKALVDHICPERWDALRPVQANELAATVVLRVPLDKVAAKIRTGMPGDERDDPGWPVWTGVWPFRSELSEALPDPTMPDGPLPGAPPRR